MDSLLNYISPDAAGSLLGALAVGIPAWAGVIAILGYKIIKLLRWGVQLLRNILEELAKVQAESSKEIAVVSVRQDRLESWLETHQVRVEGEIRDLRQSLHYVSQQISDMRNEGTHGK